jgi:hypothetical protein
MNTAKANGMSQRPRTLAESVALSCALLASCSISTRPEPPPATPPETPTVDTTLVSLEPPCPMCTGTGTLDVVGQPGAASDPAAVLWAVNLDSSLAPSRRPVAPDGSFVARIDALAGDEIRLQLVKPTARSIPIDVVVTSGLGAVQLAPKPLGDCLSLTPALELDLPNQSAPSAPLHVANHCAASIRIERIALRTAAAGASIQAPAAPFDLLPSTPVDVMIQFDSAAAASLEEILFVEASSPQRDRRAITLRAGPGS